MATLGNTSVGSSQNWTPYALGYQIAGENGTANSIHVNFESNYDPGILFAVALYKIGSTNLEIVSQALSLPIPEMALGSNTWIEFDIDDAPIQSGTTYVIAYKAHNGGFSTYVGGDHDSGPDTAYLSEVGFNNEDTHPWPATLPKPTSWTVGFTPSIYLTYTPGDPEPPADTGQIKVNIGGTFTPKPVKHWNGSAWVEKPLKRWTGSVWVETDS